MTISIGCTLMLSLFSSVSLPPVYLHFDFHFNWIRFGNFFISLISCYFFSPLPFFKWHNKIALTIETLIKISLNRIASFACSRRTNDKTERNRRVLLSQAMSIDKLQLNHHNPIMHIERIKYAQIAAIKNFIYSVIFNMYRYLICHSLLLQVYTLNMKWCHTDNEVIEQVERKTGPILFWKQKSVFFSNWNLDWIIVKLGFEIEKRKKKRIFYCFWKKNCVLKTKTFESTSSRVVWR